MKARTSIALGLGVIATIVLAYLWVITPRLIHPATPSLQQGSRIPASHLEPPSPPTVEELKIGQRGWIGSKAIWALRPGKTAVVLRAFPVIPVVISKKEVIKAASFTRYEFGTPVLIGKDQDGLYAICFDPNIVIEEISPYVARYGRLRRASTEDLYLPLRFSDAKPGEKPETAQW